MEWRISSVFSGEGCADDSDVCSGEVTCTCIGRNLDRDGANRCILRLPYVGANNLDIERRVRSVVGRAFGEVNVVTVYVTRRAFMVKEDILPTTS